MTKTNKSLRQVIADEDANNHITQTVDSPAKDMWMVVAWFRSQTDTVLMAETLKTLQNDLFNKIQTDRYNQTINK